MNRPVNEQETFEARLRILIRDEVDQRLGSERPAPPFDPSLAKQADDWRRRPWFIPVVAAACALVLALGVFLVATRTRQTGPVPAVPAPTRGLQQAMDARIALPPGWVLRPEKDYSPDVGDSMPPGGFCLSPASTPATENTLRTCPLWLWSYDRDEAVDPDANVGDLKFRNPCGAASIALTPKPEKIEGGSIMFGGREAEWRRWTFRCSANKTEQVERYVVPTAPSWTLLAGDATAAVRQAIDMVIAGSVLPAQTTPLRLVDRGVITSITDSKGEKRVTIDRTRGWLAGGVAKRTGTTITYDVPSTVFEVGTYRGPLKVGTVATIGTDGTAVSTIGAS